MQIDPLVSSQAAIVYLDFKSPYAYLAVEATRRLENELGLSFDWRPFVLDIPSYLGSASLDSAGQVAEQDRTSAQWAAVKYAYYDCRRYASINHLTIRGTTKIWNTNLAATAMLWVRDQAADQLSKFIDLIYLPFWKRELDIEDSTAITAVVEKCGLSGSSFLEWAKEEGSSLNRQLQKDAFAAGIYGVPTYVTAEQLYFGREHLPRIAWHLDGCVGPAPDIENTLPNNPRLSKLSKPRITVGIDTSIDSLLAIAILSELLDNKGVSARWARINSTDMADLMPPSASRTRSGLHREFREATNTLNQQRYAQHTVGSDLDKLIEQQLLATNLQSVVDARQVSERSPFPGVRVTLDDEIFIGRQHIPLITALLN